MPTKFSTRTKQLPLFRDPHCTRCKLHKTAEYICLLGQGPTPCKIMVIGEAPGKREDDSGKAFVGKAGAVLEDLLDMIGVDRHDIFISNAVHCRPPDNRTPSKAEIKACRHWLDHEISVVKPKFVLILGNVPLFSITDKTGIGKARGQPFEKDGIIFFPTYHPAATLYDERLKKTLEEDFKRFGDIIDFGGVPYEKKVKPICVDSEYKFEELLHHLRGEVSWDSETTGLYPWEDSAQIISIGFGTEQAEYGIPWHHPQSPWRSVDLERMVDRLDKVIRVRQKNGTLTLITQNGKFDHLWIRVHHGVKWYPDFDTLLAHHVIDENDLHDLEHLAQLYFGAPPYDIPLKEKQGQGPLDRHIRYLCSDLYYTRRLKPKLEKLMLEDGTDELFAEITMPSHHLFCDAEYYGNCIDLKRMGAVERKLRKDRRLAKITLDTYGRINWASPQQVANLFFEKLGIKPLDKTNGGKWSTSESVLKRLDHPTAKSLLKFREAEKQISGFIEGWKPYITGQFIHPSFKLHGTRTGRLSSEHPNWQQIPRDPFIRSLITAPEGWELVEADLSQIELRIAAELAQESNMLAAFAREDDIHWITALHEVNRSQHEYGKLADETAKLYLMQSGLSPNGTSAKILLKVWQSNKKRTSTSKILQLASKARTDQETWRWIGGKSERFEEWLLDRRLSDMATPISKELLRALWQYTQSLSTSQRSQSLEQEKIQFTDAVSILSCCGASIACELRKEWKELRKKAKAISFGYLFGMWWKKFILYARDNYEVDVTEEEAQESRENFFDMWPAYVQWHKDQRRFAQRNGYVRSMAGRKRHLPRAADSGESMEKDEAQRQAINSPVQSFASDLNLMAAIEIRQTFSEDTVRIVATVHDSILMWIKKTHLDMVLPKIHKIMKHPRLLDRMNITLRVPIESEISVGPWGAGKKWRPVDENSSPSVRSSDSDHSASRRRNVRQRAVL